MTATVLLAALLCPVGAPAAACTVDSARVAIVHAAPAGTPCTAALAQLLAEAARSPIQGGPGEAWRFGCTVPR